MLLTVAAVSFTGSTNSSTSHGLPASSGALRLLPGYRLLQPTVQLV